MRRRRMRRPAGIRKRRTVCPYERNDRARHRRARSGRESPPPKKKEKEKPPARTNALAGLFAAETAGAESASFAFGF